MDTQIKKGILEIAILQVLSTKSTYGYQLMQELSEYFDVNESGIYAILRRLCEKGYLYITMSEESLGPVRKIYHISNKGIEYLKEQCEELRKVLNVLKVLGVKL